MTKTATTEAGPAVVPSSALATINVHVGCVFLPVLELADPAVILPDAFDPIGGHFVGRTTEEEMKGDRNQE
jgi:hypothetical protein